MANPVLPQDANSTNEDQLLKDWYTHRRIEDLVYPELPFLSMLNKNMGVSGRQMVTPQIYSDPQGTSNTFSKSLGNQFPLVAAAFVQTANQKYTIESIQARLIKQSRDQEGGFMPLMKANMDKSIRSHSNRMNIDLVANDGTSALAQIASATVVVVPGYTNVVQLQLVIPEQSRYFETNAIVTMGVNNVAPYGNTNIGIIISIQRTPGIIQVACQAVPFTNVAYLGFDGDYITNDLPSGATSWQGLAAWVPTVAARTANSGALLSNPFNGVVRSVDPDRLAGVALDLTGSPVKSALIRTSSAIQVNGGRPNIALMHEFDFASLEESLGPNVRYEMAGLGGNNNIGFSAIMVQTPGRPIKVVQESCVPRGTIYVLSMETWELGIWQDFTNIVDDDGLTVLRTVNDSVQWRVRTFGALTNHAVGWNGVVSI